MKRHQHAGRRTSDGVAAAPLSDADLEVIHLATLDVLDRIGVWVEADDACDVLADGGCRVNRGTHRVNIPPDVVEEAIRFSPPTFVLAGRDPDNDLLVEDGRVGFTNFCEGICVNDLETGENRPSTKKDVSDIARAVDYCDQIDVYCQAVSPRDVSSDWATAHGFEASVGHITKHILIPAMSRHETQACIDMAAVVMGGPEHLQERPIISAGSCPVSPLKLTTQCTDVQLTVARAGLPTVCVTQAMAGGSAPTTLAGTLVVHNAEVLSQIVLVQLAERGTKCLYGSSTCTLDLRLGACSVGSPEFALLGACIAQLSHKYRIPSFIAGL